MSAVMQQDYVSSRHSTAHFSLDCFCGIRVPVESRDVPHDGFKAHFPRDPQYRRAAPAKRWTKDPRVISDRIRQCLLAFFHLDSTLYRTLENQQWMREGVVAYRVSGVRHFTNDVWPHAHITANHKERRFDIMLCKYFEKTQRVRIVWAVVIRERQLL